MPYIFLIVVFGQEFRLFRTRLEIPYGRENSLSSSRLIERKVLRLSLLIDLKCNNSNLKLFSDEACLIMLCNVVLLSPAWLTRFPSHRLCA